MQQQRREEGRCAQMQAMPNTSIDGGILCIRTEYDTCTAPFDAIFGEINRNNTEFNCRWKDWHDQMARYQLIGLKCWDPSILGGGGGVDHLFWRLVFLAEVFFF